MPKSDERFARQYRYEPPSEFPLTSPCSGIVHHLSGPNKYAIPANPHYGESRRSCTHRSGIGPQTARCHPSLSLRIRVCHPNTRACVRLLGPCFKTGRIQPFRQDPERADGNPQPMHRQAPQQRFAFQGTSNTGPQAPRPRRAHT